MGDTLLTTYQAADLLGLRPRRIRQLVDDASLKGEKRGRDLVVSLASIQRLIEQRKREAEERRAKRRGRR